MAFAIAIIGGGLLYYSLSQTTDTPINTPVEGMYHVLGLTFLQPMEEFPDSGYLQAFYFLMPLIGIGIFAQGFTEFGVLFFNRRARSKEWEMAVASTFSKHAILVGLGHLGYRVVHNLYKMDQDVVVIEKNPKADLSASARQMGAPVIEDDATRESTLKSAGVERARSIVLCTQNDSLNLQIALKARSLNPKIRVIIRIFDEDFARVLREQYVFMAMSATGMAAPAFASAAAGVDISTPIAVEGQALSLARLNVNQNSKLVGKSVGEIEGTYDISIVLLRRDDQSDFHPSAERCLEAGDTLAILGGPAEISATVNHNNES